ncbi:disease resistance-like protein DSC1 isoform X2 [Morus notabilis]|nr:disease resistance-like protein DSC1 isoform X2 [Morus notabilis]
MDRVRKWRVALTESANLSGWDSRITRPESKLVEAIVEDVLRKLNRGSSSNFIPKGLIGIERQIAEIKSLLSVSSPKVCIAGIWGMGGIGKTTLAQVIFDQLSSQFEACCFVANVREESGKGSLINLRNKLLSELLREENLNVGTPSLGPTFVKERLKRTKVLIVLDDVNHVEQLNFFVGDRDQFSCESRIIVTTRDVMVLRDIAVDGMYEVEKLHFNESLQLFNSIVFRENAPDMDYKDLSKNVVEHAGGLPLAITVLGKHFRSLSQEIWEMALEKLKSVPHNDIHNVLRISYDGLEKIEKDIFLDIACFFKGMCGHFVERILNGCDFFASIGVRILSEKSLITIDPCYRLQMHDLLQEMGKNIVRQESTKLGERSRLWIPEEARQVLENKEGNEKVEGIFLDLSEIDEEIHLKPKVFKKMAKLRLLKIYNSSYVKKGKLYLQDLRCLPPSLRYLEWHEYPLKYLPSNFKPKNLVDLKMPYSHLEQLWVGVQELNKLRDIDLRHSIHLTQIPDLSSAPNLERINLEYCTNLFQVPLHTLNTLPMTITRSLVSLNLSSTGITSLPSSIVSLNNLSKLSLRNCTRLASLPSCMNKLDSLKELGLGGCSILERFPELPLNIMTLDIGGTAIKHVSASSIEDRFYLRDIGMSNCKSLASLPPNIFKMRSLCDLNLNGCANLKSLPEILDPMKILKWLRLSGTGIRELPIYDMAKLSDLDLSDFPISSGFLRWDLEFLDLSGSNIIAIPTSVKGLSKLIKIYVNNCRNLRSIPELPLGLQVLDARGCTSLEVVSNSKRALTQEFWDYVQNERADFTEYSIFCDCLKLDQKQRQSILMEFQLRVFRTATRFICKDHERLPYSIGACCPGYEIPMWLEYQSEGAFIDIKPPLERQNFNFLGIVFCVVGYCYSDTEFLRVRCEVNLKANEGENREFTSAFQYIDEVCMKFSSNVWMWYVPDDNHKWLNPVEASFDFSLVGWDKRKSRRFKTSKHEVKKCGIHLVYQKEIEEFRFNFINAGQHHVLEESAAEQPESIARETVDFDTDEPRLKRIKFTDSFDC